MSQPFLDRLSMVVHAPVQVWSDPQGRIGAAPGAGPSAQGIYCGDDRVADLLVTSVLGCVVEPIGLDEAGGGRATYRSVVRAPERGVDPSIVLEQRRTADAQGVGEELVVRASRPAGAGSGRVGFTVQVRLAPDATTMADIKAGATVDTGPRPAAAAIDAGATWSWRPGTRARLVAPGARVRVEPGAVELAWDVDVADGEQRTYAWRLDLADDAPLFTAAPPRAHDPLADVATRAAGSADALARLVATAGADLAALRMSDPAVPGSAFFGAGAPWYFTLFGRDSLIAARLLLPYDPATALGTLRTLAARQGTRIDGETAEQPGKILHEVRRVELDLHDSRQAGHAVLPPVYYGTIDATCLWVLLLADTWRSGVGDEPVRALLPNLRAALHWLTDHADADGDGFLEYRDLTGRGLANQGWKDSGDAVRRADGSIAESPIALCEVQGYAYAAARAGAELLRWLGDDDHDLGRAGELEAYAAALAERFRTSFWAEDASGPYPVLALDGHKEQVDGVASNMGHLLGTGLLSREESDLVVARLMDETLFSGYGIRTLSSDNPGYWPLGYHVGSVWTHDTAMIIAGLLADDYRDEARALATGLLRAAEGFGYRLPELFGGQAADDGFPPWPYPASCRPQAWAAASAVVIARALSED